jgi:hypothetical protein
MVRIILQQSIPRVAATIKSQLESFLSHERLYPMARFLLSRRDEAGHLKSDNPEYNSPHDPPVLLHRL